MYSFVNVTAVLLHPCKLGFPLARQTP